MTRKFTKTVATESASVTISFETDTADFATAGAEWLAFEDHESRSRHDDAKRKKAASEWFEESKKAVRPATKAASGEAVFVPRENQR